MRDNKECCPYCKADYKENLSQRSTKTKWFNSLYEENSISSIEADRIIKWKFPDCNKEWDRD